MGPEALTPEERALVKDAVLFWHRRKWLVHALAVMPTHAHILATPLMAGPGDWYSLSDVLHSVKCTSARRVNQHRGRRGALWERESYDHIIRNERELHGTFDYIAGNAGREVKSGDGYAYVGFWCEGMEAVGGRLPSPSASEPGADSARATCRPRGRPRRLPEGKLVQRKRNLPHWEQAGSTYHIVLRLKEHRPNPSAGAAPLSRRLLRP